MKLLIQKKCLGSYVPSTLNHRADAMCQFCGFAEQVSLNNPSMGSMSSPKMVFLKSSDDKIFEIEESVAKVSTIIKYMIDDHCADSIIPVPNVRSQTLAKVIEYCRRHVDDSKLSDYEKDELKNFDADFMKVDLDTLYDLIMAANFLSIKSLVDLACQMVVDMIKGKTPEEVRTTFNIKNDFTPEEEEQIRRENAWAFE